MARIFVSGASGFIGKALCARLSRLGHHVIAGVRIRTPSSNLECESICETGPLELHDSLQGHLAGVDVVIHAAGWAGNPRPSTAGQHRTDHLAARQLCRAAANAGVEHFVLISSVKAIGAQTHEKPFDEMTPLQPKDSYGAIKLQTERSLSGIEGITKTIIRLPAIYGPEMRGGMLTLFALASRHVPLPLKGHQNARDFLSLTSMSDFVTACVERPPQSLDTTRVLLVCDGRPVSSSDLYDLIGRSLGYRSLQFGIPEFLSKAAATSRSGSLQSLFGSLRVNDAWSRAQLQWAPPVDLEEALQATAAWYRTRID